MRRFWNQQLAGIAGISVPDSSLDDAYRSGFIYTQIARSGDNLNTGVNGYESEFSHDVMGILANLFTQGYFSDAHALLLEARNVVGSQGQYLDGVWTYAWPWAIYLMKTGDVRFVKENFAPRVPWAQRTEHRGHAHDIAADRTGPSGIMEATNDIDTQGYWTTDDYEALTGPGRVPLSRRAHRGPSRGRVGGAAVRQPAVGDKPGARRDHQPLWSGLPALLAFSQPNTANRCANPEDANWTSPFGFGGWAWDRVSLRRDAQRSGHFPDRRHLRLRLRAPRRAPFRRTPSVGSRATTTRPATTRSWAARDWPARTTATRGS